MLSSFVYRCEEIRMKDYYLNDRTPPPRLSDDLAKLCLMGCSLQFAKANDVAQSSKGSTVSAWLELNPVPSCKHGASCLWLFIHKLASYSRTTCMFQHHPTTQVNRFGRSEIQFSLTQGQQQPKAPKASLQSMIWRMGSRWSAGIRRKKYRVTCQELCIWYHVIKSSMIL